jgi:outer membrane receptor protein involved in Fe transport
MSVKNSKPVIRPLALAIMTVISSQAFAQEKAANDNTPLNLDAIIVTGQPQGISKMKSSVSISTMSDEQITRSGATNAAELLRSVPGIRSESSGGDSNANVTARGAPISAGGSRYVQFQEDGLPTLLFGDIAFATPDTFVRTDYNVDRLEVVRGGSASTLATNSPGGIINFISKTGKDTGGNLGLTVGGARYNRLDFDYGVKDNEKTYTHIGGFYRLGEGGPRDSGVNVEKGGQLKAAITREFDKGYVRLNFKFLNDNTPSYLPVPVKFTGDKISELPGIDPRTATFYSPYLRTDRTLTRDNGTVSTNLNDGFSAKTSAFGVEAKFNLPGGIELDNKFRTAANSGRFVAIFPGSDVGAAPAGTTYATGPNAGNPYTGNAFSAVVFNTSLDDFGLTVNDVKLTKNFGAANNQVSLTGGLFTALQKLDVTWNFNEYLLEAVGQKAAVLSSATNGQNAFGGCCSNTSVSDYKAISPYIQLGTEMGAFNGDISFRRDRMAATGTYNQLLFAPTGATTYDFTKERVIDWNANRNSYSAGGNFRLNKDTSLFARYSNGASFMADRITFFNDAKLVNGQSPVPINIIKQAEGGVKFRSGNFSTFATLFTAKTDEQNVDLTSATPVLKANKYDSKGIELESSFVAGGFRLAGGLTYTKAKVTESSDTARVGKAPKRQADVVYQITPSYNFGNFNVGASIIGTTDSKDDSPAGPVTVTLPAYAVINAFANYEFAQGLSASFGVNNLANQIGYTESNDGRQAARSINGRSVRAGLKYSF